MVLRFTTLHYQLLLSLVPGADKMLPAGRQIVTVNVADRATICRHAPATNCRQCGWDFTESVFIKSVTSLTCPVKTC